MDSSEVEAKIKQIMSAVFSMKPEDINQTTNNENVAKWDSISHMNLIVALEDGFGIEFLDREIGPLTSYPKILGQVQSKLAG